MSNRTLWQLIKDFFRKLFRMRKTEKFSDLSSSSDKTKTNNLEIDAIKSPDIKNVTQIDVTRGKDIISFKKVSLPDINKNMYQEIPSDIMKGGMSNAVAAGVQMAAIHALNPNGLFSATVTPQLLTKFADGTFSTMIHQGGHIAKHAGFMPISATVFAPIAVMQLMSMITGQYYLNGITKQLKSIDEKLDYLIKLHHGEKNSKLEYAKDLLGKLCNIENPGDEHLMQLKIIESVIGPIYHEYFKYLKESMSATDKIDKAFNLFTKIHFDNLNSIDQKSNFSFYLFMVTSSDIILHLIPITEFMLNVKMYRKDNDRSRQIVELYNKIASFSEKDIFANSTGKEMLENYYNAFIKEAEEITKRTTFINVAKIMDRRDQLKEHKKTLSSGIIEDAKTLLGTKEEFVENMSKPVEILYSRNDDDGKLYIGQQKVETI